MGGRKRGPGKEKRGSSGAKAMFQTLLHIISRWAREWITFRIKSACM